MKINYIGIFDNQFKYKIELKGHLFDYFTGIGWTSLTKNLDTRVLSQEDQEKVLSIDKQLRQKVQNKNSMWVKIYRKVPTENDILECLKSDCEAGQMSFQDFCDNFGYDSDSIKALNVYRACMDTATKLRGFKFPELNEEEVG